MPFRLLKAFHKIQQRLVRELEKKFSGKDVVIIANRRILPASKGAKGSQRPRSRTLTAVSSGGSEPACLLSAAAADAVAAAAEAAGARAGQARGVARGAGSGAGRTVHNSTAAEPSQAQAQQQRCANNDAGRCTARARSQLQQRCRRTQLF